VVEIPYAVEVFAEGQVSVVAAQLIARHQGTSGSSSYEGRGVCCGLTEPGSWAVADR
jgi:hypothetical protein